MNQIDASITSDKRKHKVVVLAGFSVLATILVCYVIWLFLFKGFIVTVLPAQAAPHAHFSVTAGTGFFIENKLYMLGSDVNINVGADKFEPATVTVKNDDDTTLTVTLLPLPASLVIETNAATEGMVWSVNGQHYSNDNTLQARLKPGQYQIDAVHPAYEPARTEITAEAADEIRQALTLVQVNGQISLNTVPAGAAVTINGQSAGTTPLILPQKGGDYPVEIALAGYEPLQDTVAVTYNNPSPSRNYYLKPVQAQLTVTLNPQGGMLLLDGKPVTSPLSIDAGKSHTLRYEKAGFTPQSQTISLNAGEQRTLALTLKAEMGDVHFSANETADVLIDGKVQGQTPLTLSLQALPHNIEFRKSGFRTVSKTVTPVVRQAQSVKAEMLTEFDARRREGKPLFAETLGIKLINVQPKAFSMGSPANETDRNRNEHEIKVDFSRNIQLSAHEITEAQFAAFKGQSGGSAMPVTQVSWLDAVLFTNWLSEQEGLLPFYIVQGNQVSGIRKESRGYRLPTEAEWEFVAKHNRRAARTKYVWGNDDLLRDKQGNFADKSLQGQQTFVFRDYNDGFAGKAPVGSFREDRAGFYDLEGNVREWVHDVYAVAPANMQQVYTDYLGPASGQGHVVKGGSFKSGRMKELRASIRSEGTAAADDIGFRIARYER